MTGVRFLAGAKVFLFATAARLVVDLTQAPIQWVPAFFLEDKVGRGVKLTIYFDLMRRIRLHRVISPLPIPLYGTMLN
jgi:hypothetical protein